MDMEHREKLLKMFNEKAPIGKLFGMKLSFSKENNALIDLPYNPELDHALGLVHGGIYATMIDTAGWFTASLQYGTSCWLATSHLSIHYLLPAKETSLQAVGEIIKLGKRQCTTDMKLYDGEKNLVGYATGIFTVLSNVSM